MEAAIERMDVQYEVMFSDPLFDLPRRNVEVLESFYNNLKPEYLASPSDMQVIGGTAPSDVKIRIAMFDGLAAVEVMVDRMVVEFKRVTNSNELRICKSCVLASERAIWGIYPELQIDSTAFDFGVDVKLNGNKNANQLLRDVVRYGNNTDFSQFGDVERFPAAHTMILNKQAGWHSTFHAYAAWPDLSRLVIFFRSAYVELETHQSLDHRLDEFTSRTENVRELFKIFLGETGVHAVDLDWETGGTEQS